MHKHKGRTRFVLLCVLPATILFTIFMVVPTLQKRPLLGWAISVR